MVEQEDSRARWEKCGDMCGCDDVLAENVHARELAGGSLRVLGNALMRVKARVQIL
jgi:hypothetical protein